ncbi:YafY family protein [Rarobacter faecitabidus]|uniref:Proteasome accessory factor B n=1 Tax=Rarobacter faecitabidus TaxID=13243 RepID=A0A542ZVP3_RARFA|nr:WYL domain-containing protein [Rarobacter faecitabidus]TQL64401.1 proteasome accessory factor B [Rarobacter faecitabidus]
MAETIDKTERILQLAIALLNSRTGMTKAQILGSVSGYDSEANPDTASKMFERDKRDLRDLGFELVTIGTDGAADEVRYRIEAPAAAQYAAWFTPSQLKILTLAATLWHTAAPERDIITARMRLRALGAEPGATSDLLGDALLPESVNLTMNNETVHEAMTEALATRRLLGFTYRSAGTGATTRRKVEPWRIVARPTGWYLVARDVKVGEPRVFHLDRVIGRPSIDGREGAYEIPPAAQIDEAASLLSLAPRYEARLRIDRGKGQSLRARANSIAASDGAERDEVTIPYRQDLAFAREIAGYGPAVLVIEPDSLREKVIEILVAASKLGKGVAAHGE